MHSSISTVRSTDALDVTPLSITTLRSRVVRDTIS